MRSQEQCFLKTPNKSSNAQRGFSIVPVFGFLLQVLQLCPKQTDPQGTHGGYQPKASQITVVFILINIKTLHTYPTITPTHDKQN
jgi:hypothetical protein